MAGSLKAMVMVNLVVMVVAMAMVMVMVIRVLQGIWLCEHRDHASGRRLVVTVLGE